MKKKIFINEKLIKLAKEENIRRLAIWLKFPDVYVLSREQLILDLQIKGIVNSWRKL